MLAQRGRRFSVSGASPRFVRRVWHSLGWRVTLRRAPEKTRTALGAGESSEEPVYTPRMVYTGILYAEGFMLDALCSLLSHKPTVVASITCIMYVVDYTVAHGVIYVAD